MNEGQILAILGKIIDEVTNPGSVESLEQEAVGILIEDAQSENFEIFHRYHDSYLVLIDFVESSNVYKCEMSTLLYPILVYMYIDLIENDLPEEAAALMTRFGPDQKFYYQDDLKKISIVTNRHQMENNDLIQTLRSNKFVLKMSKRTMTRLRYNLEKPQLFSVGYIIQTYLGFDIHKGIRMTESDIDAISGGMMGTLTNPNDMVQVFYGTFPLPEPPVVINTGLMNRRPQLDSALDEEPETPTQLPDPNVPPRDRIPLPPLTKFEIKEKINEYKESLTRVVLGPKALPSIMFHTILNANNNVSCAKISDDLSMLAVGCLDSVIKVFSINGEGLKTLKSPEELPEIDFDECDFDEINKYLFGDPNDTKKMQTLIGHSNFIYSVSFCKNCINLLSCSEDKSIRLWSLQMWCCTAIYKHTSPVYDVKFSPLGYYFASASSDKTASLWATDNKNPLRIFAGHFSEVNCIQFHPNSNYVATGSSDRYVRLWDCLSGDEVRVMSGHKSTIRSLEFSVCGRFLVSAGKDIKILVWDIKFGSLVAALKGHNEHVRTLAISKCGNVLASGSLDCILKLWDFGNITKDIDLKDNIGLCNQNIKDDDYFLLKEYETNGLSVRDLHFTKSNLLLSANACNGESVE